MAREWGPSTTITSSYDIDAVGREGLLVVAYFNGVLRKESEDNNFYLSTKAAFVFPELLADFPKK
jgi:hypothetical protein